MRRMSLGVFAIARPLPKGADSQVLAEKFVSLDKRIQFMVMTATNHRPTSQATPTNRMAKAEKTAKKPVNDK